MLKCLVAAWQDADGPSNSAGDLSLACRRHPAYETLHRRDHIFFFPPISAYMIITNIGFNEGNFVANETSL